MFIDDEDPCADCVPVSPIEFYDRLHSPELRRELMEFFNGPAQELLAQMQLALARIKAEQAEKLESEVV